MLPRKNQNILHPTSDLAPKKEFIALKAEISKLDINELVKVRTVVNDLKIKIGDLNVGKLKTVPTNLKKISDVVNKEVPHASSLIQTNRYNTDKENLEEKTRNVENKISDVNGLVTTATLNTKAGETESKIPDISDLVKNTVYDIKISKIQRTFFTISDQYLYD